MGVDVEMLVRMPREMTAKEVRSLSVDLCEAFGHDDFLLDRPGDTFHSERRHALSIWVGGTWGNPPGDVGGFFVEVHTLHRYYGEGYERGPLPKFIAWAEWFEVRVPGCTVYYGGDSGGVEDMVPFDSTYRKSLWEHFCKVGHRPYRGGFGSLNQDNIPGQHCDFCERPMVRNGWGSQFACWYCDGCGDARETRDGGKTVVARKEE